MTYLLTRQSIPRDPTDGYEQAQSDNQQLLAITCNAARKSTSSGLSSNYSGYSGSSGSSSSHYSAAPEFDLFNLPSACHLVDSHAHVNKSIHNQQGYQAVEEWSTTFNGLEQYQNMAGGMDSLDSLSTVVEPQNNYNVSQLHPPETALYENDDDSQSLRSNKRRKNNNDINNNQDLEESADGIKLESCKSLACPFYKRDPITHASCQKYISFPTVHRLKYVI